MEVCYHPMYPKLIHRFVKVMGPGGLKNFLEDTKIDKQDIKKFIKTGNINPIAEHIPIMWSTLFEKRTPIQALQLLEENDM